MDFIDLNFSNILVSRKKVIPVHYQKRYKANLSNSAFNQSFALGVWKRKVKTLLENNKCLVTAVQNYRCESSSKEKIWTEYSTAALEHIFSAKLKLSQLANVLKEAHSSVEEIVSLLQLCSSVFPSKFKASRKSGSRTRHIKRSKVSLIEPIKEVQESLSTPGGNFSIDVLETNQGGSNLASPPTFTDDSGCKSNLTNSATSGTDQQMPQKLTHAPESVVLAAPTSSLTRSWISSATKNPKEMKKLRVTKSRIDRKPSAIKQLPKKRLQSSQNLNVIPVSDEILPVSQDDCDQPVLIKKSKLSIETVPVAHEVLPTLHNSTLQAISAKKSKLLIQSTPRNMKQHTEKLKLPRSSSMKGKKRGKTKNTSHETFENVHPGEFSSEPNHAIDTIGHINQFEAPVNLNCSVPNQDACDVKLDHSNLLKDSEPSKAQIHCTPSISCQSDQNLHGSEDVVIEYVSKTIANSKAQEPSKEEQHIQEPCSELSDGNKIPKSIISKGSRKSSANKCKNQVNFCLDDDDNAEQGVMSVECNKKNSRLREVPKKVKGCMSPERTSLQSVENISCLSENLSKNICVVSAEIHPPPSDCIPNRISPRNLRKNMQPCVVLTDIFDSSKPICSLDSLEDLTVSAEAQQQEVNTDLKVSKKHGKKDHAMDLAKALDSPKKIKPRCRNSVSYKEQSLNRKMRRL